MVTCPGCGEDNPPRFRLCGYCGTALAAAVPPPREARKTVTLVFCDLKGSTALGEALDAEALHEVKERYFQRMAAEIIRHGGKVEKYIGDAIMAVFGLPRAREDDALRAVRAAWGMGEALRTLNLDLQRRYGVTLCNRTGVNTGEVVATDDPGADQKLATGDAVNVTARLEQNADDDQILVGEVTYRLVRHAVLTEAVAPLELKGKAQRIAAWRVTGLRQDGADGRRQDAPLAGREDELARLLAEFDAVCEGRHARLVTLVGDAGIGKSRLVHELRVSVADRATVLTGRCLPYGEGITFWPLRMVVLGAAGVRDSDDPAQALARVRESAGDDEVAERLAAAIGLPATVYPLAEIQWAARKFLQHHASRRPLVVVLDDVHWAEPAFLELVEHLLAQISEAPVLLLATGRHELLEERPTWSEGERACLLLLKPLDAAASAEVMAHLVEPGTRLPPALVRRITERAAGNPLFVEQMLSMLMDSGWSNDAGDGEGRSVEVWVPPTVQALLEARLDALPVAEREVVGPAAVVGLEFEQAAVASLCEPPPRAQLPHQLQALVRRRFIEPLAAADRAQTFHFQNHLVRDTAYHGLLKRSRAQLHLRFVRWADEVNALSDRGREFEEILGYHLEQAHRCLKELGPLDDEGRAIGADGARRLAAAGQRALARGDLHAAANLLQRAAQLHEPGSAIRAALLPALGEALTGLGNFDGARQVLAEARDQGEPRVQAAGELSLMLVSLYAGQQQSDWSERALATAERLLPGLQAMQAHDELAAAWRLMVLVHGIAGHYSRAAEAVEAAIAHARAAGNERLLARNGLVLAVNALHGPLPVGQGIAQCERLLAEGLADRQVACNVMGVLAQLRAMHGEPDEAQALLRRSRSLLRDLGQGVYAASTGIDLARVALLGGDVEGALREIAEDQSFLASKGETYFLSTLAALHARLLREQGRDEEALAMSVVAEQATASDDTESQALWRMARAGVLARRGQAEPALQLAAEAVELVQRTESPVLQAEGLAELAEVQRLAGRIQEARETFHKALALCEAKGNRVRAQQLMDVLSLRLGADADNTTA